MKNISIALALLAICFTTTCAHAGIFGHRRAQPAGGYYYYPQQPAGYVQQQPARYVQQPSTVYRSYSQQPRASDFPYSSRSDPRDWKEAHRGYGVKIRGW